MIAQLCALHAPGALEIALLAADRSRPAEQRAEEWAWLHWLPHLRPAHGQDCRLLTATDREQAEARVGELVRRIEEGPLGTGWATATPEAVAKAAADREGPHTLLVVDGDPGSAYLGRPSTGSPPRGRPSASMCCAWPRARSGWPPNAAPSPCWRAMSPPPCASSRTARNG